MWQTKIVPAINWWIDNTTIFIQSYPHVVSALWFFLLLATGVLLYSFKVQSSLSREGRFDKELWERILSLILQHRTKDAAALVQVHEGAFPRLYQAGLEAAASRKNAADMVSAVKEESQEKLARPLTVFSLLGLLAPFVGLLATAASAWKVYEDTSLTLAIGLGRLFPPMLPLAAGLMTGMLAGILYGYFSLRIRKIVTQLHLCGLKLLHTMFEQTVSRYESQLVRRVLADEPALAVGAGRGAGSPNAAPAAAVAPAADRAPTRVPAPAAQAAPAAKPAQPAEAPKPSWPPTTLDPGLKPKPPEKGVEKPASGGEETVWDSLTQHHF